MAAQRKISIVAIIVGWLTIEIIAFLLGVIIGASASSGLLDAFTAQKILLFGVSPIAAAIGGFVAGSLSGQRKLLQGFLAGSISVLFSIGYAFVQTNGDLAQLIAPEPLFSWVLTPVFSTFGALFSRSK